MSQTLATRDVKLGNWILNVTTRDNGEDTQLLEELTYRTIIMWVNIVRRLEKNTFIYEGESVEKMYAAEINKRMSADTDASKSAPFEFSEPWGSNNSRVTVWSTYRGNDNPNFHLNSDDVPQAAIDVWVANSNAVDRAVEKLAALMPQTTPQAPQLPVTDEQAQFDALPSMQPATPKNTPPATTGAIVATRAPNANRPEYTNGQLVSFTVNKIVATSNKGSAVYQMWTALGTQYPTISVYKLDTKGGIKPDFEAIVPVLNTLNLTLDKPEAIGTWRLICKAAHVPSKDNTGDREYLNVVSLTAI